MQRVCGGGLCPYLGRSRPHAAARAVAPCAAMRWVMVEKSAEVIVATSERGATRCPFETTIPEASMERRTEPDWWHDPATFPRRRTRPGEPCMGLGAGQRKRSHALPLFRKERRRAFATSCEVGRRPEPPCYGPVWPVVWGAGVRTSRLPDSTLVYSRFPQRSRKNR